MSTEGFRVLSLPALSDLDSERTERQARTRGHAAGYSAGLRAAHAHLATQQAAQAAAHAQALAEGRDAIDQAIRALAAATRAAETRALPVLQQAEDTLAGAAIDLAEAIIGHELSEGEASARSALARVLGAPSTVGLTLIRMNPEDLARVDAENGVPAGVDLVADPSLDRGDALAQLPDGFLDARIGAALARARAALLGERS